MLNAAIHKTPIGNLYLIADDQVLIGAGFRSFKDLLMRMEPSDSSQEVKEVRKLAVISDLISDPDQIAANCPPNLFLKMKMKMKMKGLFFAYPHG